MILLSLLCNVTNVSGNIFRERSVASKLFAEEYIDTVGRNCTLNKFLVSYSQSERVKAKTRYRIGKIIFLNLKSCLKKCFKNVSKKSCFHLSSYSSAFMIRAALTLTIIILINILTRHELP